MALAPALRDGTASTFPGIGTPAPSLLMPLVMLGWEGVQAPRRPRVHWRSLSAVPAPERAVPNLPRENHRSLIQASIGGGAGR